MVSLPYFSSAKEGDNQDQDNEEENSKMIEEEEEEEIRGNQLTNKVRLGVDFVLGGFTIKCPSSSLLTNSWE